MPASSASFQAFFGLRWSEVFPLTIQRYGHHEKNQEKVSIRNGVHCAALGQIHRIDIYRECYAIGQSETLLQPGKNFT